MADFTVRIELKNADGEDYEKLHEQMEARGYSREITSDTGQVVKLLDAEYVTTKNLSTTAVRDEVKQIADSVKSPARVLVTKSVGRAWFMVPKK